MSESMGASPDLVVRLTRRVHPGLVLDVAFELGPVCGVVFGSSGVGKTTLLRLLAGFDRPDAGLVRIGPTVLFDSAAGVHVPLRHRRIGMVFQNDVLFPHLDVAANLRYGLRGQPRALAEARVEEVAALCGVEHLLGRRPATLSGGERQRVGLARALAPRPCLLLCDEPVSALDLASRHAILANLKQVQAAAKIPLLYVTHSPSEAEALGTVMFRLENGRIVDRGAPLDVLAAAHSAWPPGAEGLRNTFDAQVEPAGHDENTTTLRLIGGPILIVPRVDRPAGSTATVEVMAEEILLARGAVEAVSARNVILGQVERVIAHGSEAEVLVRTGELVWVVSVVEAAVIALRLERGAEVRMVIKARSCRLLETRASRTRDDGRV